MRNELNLFLGLRLHDAGRGTLRTVEGLLEEIASLEANTRIPLHWNVPLHPLFGATSRPLHDLITEIKARVANRGDVLAPPGFSGAIHPLLDDHELARELSWCRRNPWLPGFRQLLGQDPMLAIPFVPDPAREAAAGAYSSNGFRIVGIPFRLGEPSEALPCRHRGRRPPGAAPERFLLSRPPEGAALVAASVLGLSELGEDSPLLAALAARAPETLLLLIDIPAASVGATSAAPPDRPIGRLIDALSYRRSLVPAALTPAALAGLEPPSGAPAAAAAAGQSAVPLAALLHRSEACRFLEMEAGIPVGRRLEQVRVHRRAGRRRNEDVRKVLELLAPDGDRPADQPASFRPDRAPALVQPSEILFAEMGGAISLPGPEFVVHFADGRLRGISRAGTEIAAGAPAESAFDFAGARCFLRTVSAASFERDGDHGLTTAFSATLGPGGGELQMQVQAYFREGLPDLCLECSVRFPAQAPALCSALPYDIPLFRFARRATPLLQTVLEDGSSHGESIPPEERYLLACGRQVLVSLGGTTVVLTAEPVGPVGTGAVTVVPLRVRREAGRWALRACLGARTCVPHPLPVAGSVGHLSFRIGVRDS